MMDGNLLGISPAGQQRQYPVSDPTVPDLKAGRDGRQTACLLEHLETA